MNWQAVPYTAILLFAAIVSAVVVIMALRVRFPSGTRNAFIVFMSGVALWSFCYAFEVFGVTLPTKLFWSNMQYAGVLIVPPALLFFILLYTNQRKWANWRLGVLFAVFSVFFLVMVWTDQSHHLLRENLFLAYEPIPELVFDWGPVFNAILFYFYLVMFLGALVLIRSMIQASQYYLGQSFALLTAMMIPWGASLIEVLRITIIPHLSPVVFSFILSGGIFLWTFWRYRLLDILPVAQRAIFENLPDGIIVLDRWMRVCNINPAATKILSLSEADSIGSNFFKLQPQLESVTKMPQPVELQLRNNPNDWYEIQTSELYWNPSDVGGLLVIIRQITQRKRFEQALRKSELQYRSVCERAHDGIAILQNDLIRYVNPQLVEMLGYSTLDEIKDKPFARYISPAECEKVYQIYSDRMNGKTVPARYEISLLHQSGAELFMEVNASLTEYAGEIADLIFLRDISDQKRTHEELKNKNQALELAARNAHLLKEMAEKRAKELETLQQATRVVSTLLDQEEILQQILDQLALVVPYNSAAVYLERGDRLEIVGCRGFSPPETVLGTSIPIDDHSPGSMVYQSQNAMILGNVEEEFSGFSDAFTHQVHGWLGVPLTIKDKAVGLLSLNSHEVDHFNKDQMQTASAFASQVAISLENARLFEEVQRLAITDPLTNLYNRRHFYSLTMHEFLRYKRYGTVFSVIMLDVDHFKHVNDTYGHLAGDKVLQTLADLFRDNMRKVDILCRFGGEEFIATLPETPAQEARYLAERLRSRIESAVIQTDAGNVRVTVSIGVAEFGPPWTTLDKLLDCADKALYAAKDGGRNQVSVFLEPSSSVQ